MQLLNLIKSRKPICVTGAASAAIFAAVIRTQCADLPQWAEWNVTARDGVSTTREYLEMERDEATGITTTREHRLVEIAGGLNYWDNGWQASQDLIELTETGAAATKGPHRVDFASNFSSPGLITLTTPRGIMQTHVIGIYYFDASSGETAQLAIPKQAIGELHPPNRVVYRDAFQGINADMRYTYTKLGFESDVIFQGSLPNPQVFGFEPRTTRVEVWHEWVNAPMPNRNSVALKRTVDPELRNRMVEPDLIDDTIELGDFLFPVGSAFDSSRESRGTNTADLNFPAPDGSVPVGKTWREIDGHKVMIEAMDWQDVETFFDKLPFTVSRIEAPAAAVSARRELPLSKSAAITGESMQVAQAPYVSEGFVLDYVTISTGIYDSPYTFQGGTTYYLSGSAIFRGTITFQPGCIIKYDTGKVLGASYSIACNGTPSSPSIMTSKDDNSCGVEVARGCPTVAATDALTLGSSFTTNATISGLKIRWATKGIQTSPSNCTLTHTVSNCVFEFCETGINSYSGGTAITIVNSSAIDVGTPVSCACSVTGSVTTSTSLQSYLVSGMTTLASGHTPSTDKSMFTDANYTTYNTNCWVYGKQGYTSTCTSNSANPIAWYQGAMTLITPRHAVTVMHMAPANGDFIRFIDRNNTAHIVTVIGKTNVSSLIDSCIVLLSTNLPSTVDYVALLPEAAKTKLISSGALANCASEAYAPMIALNQTKQACAVDQYYITFGITIHPSYWFSDWQGSIVDGDSGHPLFVLINDQLVLAHTFYNPGAGPWYGSKISDVNSAIVALDNAVLGSPTGYQASTVSLSSFPDL